MIGLPRAMLPMPRLRKPVMKTLHKIGVTLLVLGAGVSFAAVRPTLTQAATTPSGETPELGRVGALSVGTQTVTFDLPNRPKLTIMGAVTGRLPLETRRLSVRMWYPATATLGATPALYRHVVKSPGKPDFPVETRGVAIEGAPALTGQRYPLVLISHGYRGWANHFSGLAENLASKGYVVAAIDHADADFDNLRSFQMSFGGVMMDRAQDQRQILSQLLTRATQESTGFAALIDADKVGLIGYSMGGFGALATAGAPYDTTSKTIKQLPGDSQAAMARATDNVAPKIKALVAMAPWGGQPDNRSWSATDLAKITAPVLMIAGDQDDVVNFDHGVSWIFDHLTGADRKLLVFQAARHNIVGNPVPITEAADFSTLEFFTEPVWRSERINQINQHFITAFLDLNLKGDASKAAYLDVPTLDAAAGDWPSVPGEQLGGRFSDAAQPKYWRGFQRRWALGLKLHKAVKGATSAIEPPVSAAPTAR
jgi:predicted dienelactone hydrolase